MSLLELTANQLFKLQEAIERVRELHRPLDMNLDGRHLVCKGCTNEIWEDEKYVEYPCPTIKALEGKE
jgi:hypothetical protein